MKSALLRKAERGVAVALIALLRPSKLSALLRCPLSLRIKMLELRLYATLRSQQILNAKALRFAVILTNLFVRDKGHRNLCSARSKTTLCPSLFF